MALKIQERFKTVIIFGPIIRFYIGEGSSEIRRRITADQQEVTEYSNLRRLAP